MGSRDKLIGSGDTEESSALSQNEVPTAKKSAMPNSSSRLTFELEIFTGAAHFSWSGHWSRILSYR